MSESGNPGASLRVWRDYFPNAHIIGADVDERIMFTEERISTYVVDQTDPISIEKMWRQVDTDGFDLMIDDGLHTYDAAICLFHNSIEKLARRGLYAIEDVASTDLRRFWDFFVDKSYCVSYVVGHRPAHRDVDDNNLIIVRQNVA